MVVLTNRKQTIITNANTILRAFPQYPNSKCYQLMSDGVGGWSVPMRRTWSRKIAFWSGCFRQQQQQERRQPWQQELNK